MHGSLKFLGPLFLAIVSCVVGAQQEHEVVVVGAGLGGLTAAYRLAQAGQNVHIFEGRHRLGGRTHTHYFDGNPHQFIEEGGTFVDAHHQRIQNLADELGVRLAKQGLVAPKIIVLFKKKLVSHVDVAHMLDEIISCLTSITRFTYDPLEEYPGLKELSPEALAFLETFCMDETGLPFSQIPELDAHWIKKRLTEYKQLLDMRADWKVMGKSDEKKKMGAYMDEQAFHYTFTKGVTTLVNALAERIKEHDGRIHLDHKLVSLKRDVTDQYYVLTFEKGSEKDTITVKSKRVVMAIPFSTLRDVDMKGFITPDDGSSHSSGIYDLPYGTHSKIGVPQVLDGSNKRLFEKFSYFIDLDTQCIGWPGQAAYTVFIGGMRGARMTDPHQALKDLTHQQNALALSFRPALHFDRAKLVLKNWATDPFAKGSYSTTAVTSSLKARGLYDRKKRSPLMAYAEPIYKGGTVFVFAGEHASVEFRGYMEGAVQTGEIAAHEILKSIKK